MSTNPSRSGMPNVKRRVAHAGYTAVEVLLAMSVLIISTAGVMSMQKASIQGNLDARKLDVANLVARTWVDRLQADASAWNSATPLLTSGTTNWLATLVAANTFTPPAAIGAWSPAADILGRDIPATDASAVFCTHIRIDPLAADPATANPTLLRATVLVFWATTLAGGPAPASGGPCAVGDSTAGIAAGTYHSVFMTAALRSGS